MKSLTCAGAALTAAALFAAPALAQSRDQIRIVGSSTVFPYTQAVAEQFAGMTGLSAPVVESTGTGGGMQVFCGGVGPDFPDLTGASRAMKASEHDMCQTNGVTSVTEVLLGYDGLSIAHSVEAPEIDLSKAQLFQALASQVEVDGKIVPNPYRKWSEIDAALPDAPIQVFGPPPTSGTRDAFVELRDASGLRGLRRHRRAQGRREGRGLRADAPGRAVHRGGRERQHHRAAAGGRPHRRGHLRLLVPVREQRQAEAGRGVDGVVPDAETIASGEYAISRPLFIYVKNAHRGVIPGLDEFLTEYVSEESFGPDGYLPERGLIPLSDEEREAVRAAVAAGTPIDRFN